MIARKNNEQGLKCLNFKLYSCKMEVFWCSEWPRCVVWRCVAGRHPSPRPRTFPAPPPTPAASPASWRSTRGRKSTTLDRWTCQWTTYAHKLSLASSLLVYLRMKAWNCHAKRPVKRTGEILQCNYYCFSVLLLQIYTHINVFIKLVAIWNLSVHILHIAPLNK